MLVPLTATVLLTPNFRRLITSALPSTRIVFFCFSNPGPAENPSSPRLTT